MNRAEYLSQLNKYLRKLPKSDYENAMEYFTEYFEEAGEQRAIEELGTPKEAAADILDNLLSQNPENEHETEKQGEALVKRMTFFSYLSLLLKEFGFSRGFAILIFLLFLFLLFLGMAAVGFLGSVSLLWLGGRYLLYGIASVAHSLSGACMMAGMGIFGIGGGLLVLAGIILLGRWGLFQCTHMVQGFIIRGRNEI